MQFCLWCSMHSNDDVYPSGNKVIMGDFNGANVCDSSGRPRQHYPPPGPTSMGGGKPIFARMDSDGGGGGSSRNFPGSIFCGGKVVGDIFLGPCAPDSVGGGNGSIFPVNWSNIP